MRKVYLDNAATTQLHPEVIKVMVDAMEVNYGNPSSTHIFGREAKSLMEMARKRIATQFNVTSPEIFFTSSGTESNNIIIRSCIKDLGVTRIITSLLEHKCVMETTKEMGEIEGITLKYVNVLKNGDIDLSHLENLLAETDEKTLVTLMHANNEIGNLLDVKKVAQLVKEHNAYFHTDTVQTVAHYQLDFQDLGIDFASCSAHKFHGPKGAGFVFIKKGLALHPMITGGGQERHMRSGTENVYGVAGMDKAISLAYENFEAHKAKIIGLKKYAIDRLQSSIPNISFNGKSGDIDDSLYTLLSLKLPFKDPLIGFELELGGVATSQGSACSSGAAKASLVIETIYSQEELEAYSPLRVSFSIFNTEEDVDQLVEVLVKIANKFALQNAN